MRQKWINTDYRGGYSGYRGGITEITAEITTGYNYRGNLYHGDAVIIIVILDVLYGCATLAMPVNAVDDCFNFEIGIMPKYGVTERFHWAGRTRF